MKQRKRLSLPPQGPGDGEPLCRCTNLGVQICLHLLLPASLSIFLPVFCSLLSRDVSLLSAFVSWRLCHPFCPTCLCSVNKEAEKQKHIKMWQSDHLGNGQYLQRLSGVGTFFSFCQWSIRCLQHCSWTPQICQLKNYPAIVVLHFLPQLDQMIPSTPSSLQAGRSPPPQLNKQQFHVIQPG